MENPYQLANIESERIKSAFGSRGQIQSGNIATGIKKGDMRENLEELIKQASDKPFSILNLIPGIGSIKDLIDRRKGYKDAKGIHGKFGKTFLGRQSGDFLEQMKDVQVSPLEFGQNILGDIMTGDVMGDMFSGMFKKGTPLKSLIENIKGMDFEEEGGKFEKLAAIQKLLSSFGGR